jgi:cytochrome P450
MADHPTSSAPSREDDLDDARGALAGLLADATGMRAGDRVLDLRAGSADDAPYEPGTFDRVVALEPAPVEPEPFGEAYRLLQPGGALATVRPVLLGGPREERIRALTGASVPADDLEDREACAERLRAAGFVDVEVRSVTEDRTPLLDRLREHLRDAGGPHVPEDALGRAVAAFAANTEYVLASARKPVAPQGEDLVKDPFAAYSGIRERARMVRGTVPGVEPFWMVTRYDDVKMVLSDPRFVVNTANVPGIADDANRMDQVQLASGISPEYVAYSRANLTGLDGADHLRLRRLVSQAFTPRRVNELRPRAEEITARLLDRLPGLALDGVVDLLQHFAAPLPITVICELIGVPEEERNRFRAATWEWMAGAGLGGRTGGRKRQSAFDCVRDLIERRRARPEDDLASALIRAHDEDGDRLSDTELVWTIFALVQAGHETTVHFISNGIAALLTHPDQRTLLRTDPGLMPRAVEELLRWCGPALGAVFRYATEDVEIGDATVRKGEAVMPIVPGANYDPRIFDEPERLDITRDGGRDRESHLGLGHGLHYCLGAALVRQEASVAFEALLDRFPDVSLAVAPEDLKRGRGHMWKLLSLPVRLGN